MPNSTERAVLAGGCFWGMQDLIRRMPGRHLDAGRLHRRRGSQRHLPQPRQSRRGDRDRLRSGENQLPQAAGVLLPDPRPVDPQPPGQRQGRELPFGDLLHQRRTEARRARHHRRCRRLGPVAGQGDDGGRAGRPVLGSGARASGLSRALSERLHLPLRPPQLGAAEAGRGGVDKGRRKDQSAAQVTRVPLSRRERGRGEVTHRCQLSAASSRGPCASSRREPRTSSGRNCAVRGSTARNSVGRSRSTDTSSTSTATPRSSWSSWMVSSTSGSQSTMPDGRRSSNAGAFASCASAMPRFAMTLISSLVRIRAELQLPFLWNAGSPHPEQPGT